MAAIGEGGEQALADEMAHARHFDPYCCCFGDEDVEFRKGNELKKFFSPEVTRTMRTLWSRIDDEDYESKSEEEFLFYELMQARELLRRRLTDKQRQSWFRRFKQCGRKDPNRKGKVRPKMPYHESKRLAEQFRALFWQFSLELSSFISDVLFLFVLLDVEEDLYLASLVILTLAVLVRLVSSLTVIRTVDRKYMPLYFLGLAASLAETNSSLVLIKQSLQRKDKDGLKIYKSSGRFSRRQNKDPVAVLARNNVRAGWAELRNILSVTVVEDIPQLIIQLIYLERQREELSFFFIFAIVTTVLHILFQWIEFGITYSWIVKAVPSIQHGREVEFNNSKEYELQMNGDCCSRSRVLTLEQFCERYQDDVRDIDLHASQENTKNEDLTAVVNNCKHLMSIDLAGTAVTDAGLAILARARNLRRVDLGSTTVGSDGIAELSQSCKRLVAVNLHSTAVRDEGVTALAQNCKKLYQLNLDRTEVTGEGIMELANHCQTLSILSVKFNPSVDDECIVRIAEKCPELVKIYLEETQVGDAAVHALAVNCGKLGLINVTNTGITNWALHSLADHARSLESLTLSSCAGFDDDGLIYLAGRCEDVCTGLAKVYLGLTAVTNPGVEALALHCHSLTTISLKHTVVNDTALRAIADNCDRIAKVYLDQTAVSDAGLRALADSEPKGLRRISLSGCIVHEDAVIELARSCPSLTELYLDNVGMTNAGVKKLAKARKNLEFVSLKMTHATDFTPLTKRGVQVRVLEEA